MLNIAALREVAFIFADVLSAQLPLSLAQLPIADAIKWVVVCALLFIVLVLLWQTPPMQSGAGTAFLHNASAESDEPIILRKSSVATVDINNTVDVTVDIIDTSNISDTNASIASLLSIENQTPQDIAQDIAQTIPEDFPANPFVLENDQNLFIANAQISDASMVDAPIVDEPLYDEPIAEPASETNLATPDLTFPQADYSEPTETPTPNAASSSPNITKLKATASWSTWDELIQQSAIEQDNDKPESSAWASVPLTWSTWDELSQQPENS